MIVLRRVDTYCVKNLLSDTMHCFLNLMYWVVGLVISTWIAMLSLVNFVHNTTCVKYDSLASKYDYVIVGAGTAGSIVASRLSEDTNASILLIEAGGSYSSWILDIPILSPLLQLSSLDWQFKTVEQQFACHGLNENSSRWPRGKLVGGTSHLNYLMYVRGHKNDYNNWMEENGSWGSFKDILQYFRRSEKQRGRYRNDPYHSILGPTIVNDIDYATPLAEAFINAAMELGYETRDLNGAYQTGFMQTQVHLHKGQRWNTDYGYLIKGDKNNINILCNSLVDKVLFINEFEANGVEGVHFNNKFRIFANRAIVLAAGSVGTPMILMRSGIGPSSHLNDLKIPVRHDLPVGKNLQDHITTGLDLVLLNESLAVDFGSIASVSSFAQYMLYGKGPWTITGCEAYGIVHSNLADPQKEMPDLQLMALPMGLSSDYGSHMRKAVGVKQEVWNEYFSPLIGRHVASIMPVLLHPKSHGEVRLKSQSVLDPPLINPNYLSHKNDVKTLYEGIKLVKKLIHTKAFQKLGAHLNRKSLPGCENKEFDSPEYWYCYIQHLTLTSYHPVGTCKMGHLSDNTSVVDSDLRVHGTNKLFVIDASVMPSLPSGNINAVVMMIAEKGADAVKWYWHQTTKKSNLQYIFSKQMCEK